MTDSIPREVNGLWYPVPCPEGVPLSLGFPTELACLSFCEAVDPMLEAWDAEWDKREDALFDEMNKAEREVENRGYESGWDDHAVEGCDGGTCECFIRGMALAQSVESA